MSKLAFGIHYFLKAKILKRYLSKETGLIFIKLSILFLKVNDENITCYIRDFFPFKQIPPLHFTLLEMT